MHHLKGGLWYAAVFFIIITSVVLGIITLEIIQGTLSIPAAIGYFGLLTLITGLFSVLTALVLLGIEKIFSKAFDLVGL